MSKSEVKEVFKGCGAHAEHVGEVHQGNMLLLVEYWLTLVSPNPPNLNKSGHDMAYWLMFLSGTD